MDIRLMGRTFLLSMLHLSLCWLVSRGQRLPNDSLQRFYEYSLNNNVAKGSDFLR
jgi:hypothetical protein